MNTNHWKQRAKGIKINQEAVRLAEIQREADIAREEAKREQERQERKRQGRKKYNKFHLIPLFLLMGGLGIGMYFFYPDAKDKNAHKQISSGLFWKDEGSSGIETNPDEPTKKLSFTLVNGSPSPTKNLTHTITANGGVARILEDRCDTILDPGSSCDIVVEIHPMQEGPWSTKIVSSEAKDAVLTLQGRHVNFNPSIIIEPPKSDEMNTSVFPGPTARINIINVGQGSFRLEKPTLEKDSVFNITYTDCLDVLPASGTCSVDVQLSERAGVGIIRSTLNVAGQSVALTATAYRPELMIESHTEGNIIIAKITNTGTANGDVEDPIIEGDTETFSIISNLCPGRLPPKTSCDIQIQAPAQGNAFLKVKNKKIELNGIGPLLQWRSNAVFDIQNPKDRPQKGNPIAISLQNIGKSESFSLKDQLSIEGPFEITKNGCEGSLKKNESCSVSIQAFADRDGPLLGKIFIKNGPELVLKGNASGFTPSLLWEGSNQWTDATVIRLKNTGKIKTDPLFGKIKLNASGIQMDSMCNNTLSPGEFCDIRLRRTDSRAGIKDITLSLSIDHQPIFHTTSILGPPVPSYDPSSIKINVGNTPQREGTSHLRITNNGGSALIPNMGFIGPDAEKFDVVQENCPNKLETGKTCEVLIRVRTEKTGSFSATFLANSSIPMGATIHGTAKLEPELIVQSPTIGLNNTPQENILARIENKGGMDSTPLSLNMIRVDASPKVSALLQGGGCDGEILKPGQNCTFNINIQAIDNGPFTIGLEGSGITRTTLYGNTIGLKPDPRWQRITESNGPTEDIVAELMNRGNATLKLSIPETVGTLEKNGGTCTTELLPNKTCNIRYKMRQPGETDEILMTPNTSPIHLIGRWCQASTENITLPASIEVPAGCRIARVRVDQEEKTIVLTKNLKGWLVLEKEVLSVFPKQPRGITPIKVHLEWQ